jgi:hypothetical protein
MHFDPDAVTAFASMDGQFRRISHEMHERPWRCDPGLLILRVHSDS